jgi:hypothetical protein
MRIVNNNCMTDKYFFKLISIHVYKKTCMYKKVKKRKVTKGNYSIISLEVWFLYTTLPLSVLDHSMKLHKIPTISFQVIQWTRKVMKGNNSEISQDRVMVLVRCTFSQCA